MRLYTDEELEMIGNKTIGELMDEADEIDEADYVEFPDLDYDIPVMKESRLERIKRWLSSKKEKRELNKELKREILALEDDMLTVKKSRFARIKNKISLMRENAKIKNQDRKEIKLEKKQLRKEEKLENKQLRQETRLEKKQVKQEKRELKRQEKQALREQGISTKWDVVKSFSRCAIQGALTCVAIAGTLVAAASVVTIGILPTIGITACFVGAYKIYNYLLKEELKDFDGVRKSYNNNVNEVEHEEVKETKENKVGFFKNLKNRFSKSKEKEVSDINEDAVELNSEELKAIPSVNVKDLVISKTSPKVKLTREEKIGKVKEKCQLGYIKNLNTYCVFTPKDDIKLQKFIKNEYKKEYPKEKIQSFVAGDKKVLVLSQKPNFR